MPEQTHRRRRPTAFIVSLALHAAAVGALLYRPTPPLLQPSSALRGNGGGSQSSIALVAPGVSELALERRKPRDEENKKQALSIHRAKKQFEAPKPQVATAHPSNRLGTSGFILGSLSNGFANDHDVRIAIPTFSPDPPILGAKLPEWIRGDVIIEVTISEQGAVIETKVLKSIGYGLEDTIASTLRNWRFTPAVVDGVAVASRQDVHYHFPS